jgi:hypothetical protein
MNRNWRVLVLAATVLVAPRIAFSQCSASNDPGACPLVAGPLRFDRCFGALPGVGQPTQFGNFACNALKTSHKLEVDLGNSATKFVNDAKKDINDLVKVTTDGAINKDAALKFVAARNSANEIIGDAKDLVNDPKCGANGAIKGFNQFFVEAAQNLTKAGEIAGKTVQAGGEASKAVPEVVAALAELGQLVGDVQKAGAAAESERKKLEDALKRIQQNLATLGSLDLAGAASAGGNLVTGVGPFVINCSGCAAAISAAIGQAAASLGSTTGTTAACPATGGTECIVGIPLSVITGTGSILTGAVSSVPCAAALDGADQMGEYVASIKKLVDASVKLAESFEKNVKDLQAAANALGDLAEKLPPALKPRIEKIAASIDKAGDALTKGVDILENDVAPRVERLTTQLVTQLGTKTTDLIGCWNKLNYTAALMGQDTVDAIGLLADASLNLVDGGQIVKNLQTQGADAVKAAGNKAQEKWEKVDSDYAKVHKDLWGVSPGTVDLGKTIGNLPNLVSKIGKIITDLNSYANSVGNLVTSSVDAGKNAFLNRDTLKTQSKTKFDTAEAKSRSALIELAKSKAKANAKKQAAKPAPRVVVNFQDLKKVTIVKPKKINVTTLKFKAKP